MKNPLFVGMRLPEVRNVEPLEKRFPSLTGLSIKVMKVSCRGILCLWTSVVRERIQPIESCLNILGNLGKAFCIIYQKLANPQP